MSENIIVPALGESITEATVSKWIKNQGEQVKEDEPIVELETDKVNVEVPSPAEGVISKINFKTGDTVEVGALLGTISSQGDKVTSSGKVVSNFSNEIFTIAVIGAANKTPIIPQIIPQKINDRITVIGCKPNALPNILGSKILPIIV